MEPQNISELVGKEVNVYDRHFSVTGILKFGNKNNTWYKIQIASAIGESFVYFSENDIAEIWVSSIAHVSLK